MVWAEEWIAGADGGWYEVTRTAERSGYAVSFHQHREAKNVVGLGRADTLDEAKRICEAHNKERTAR